MHANLKAGRISASELATFGLDYIAYVKPVVLDDGRTAYGIYAADGQEVAIVEDRAIAFATVQQNDLEPLSVH